MQGLLLLLLSLAAALVVVLAMLRLLDQRADGAEWARLASLQPDRPERFDPAQVADLPEPARRFFRYAIRPGTPLLPVVEIEMQGRFGLGTREAPRYQPIAARQILAAPEGFVWTMRTRGGLPMSGSDTGLWTRFRILWLVPVARQGGDHDHARSAFGRYVAEATFWSPAALLPAPGVAWSAVDADSARVSVRHGALEQAVTIHVDRDGRPLQVSFDRWSNANPQRVHRLQTFGGYLSDFREVGGYRLPFHVEAGNMFGTPDYFPFFVARVTAIHFPKPSD